jgi:hypothetical protein
MSKLMLIEQQIKDAEIVLYMKIERRNHTKAPVEKHILDKQINHIAIDLQNAKNWIKEV